MEKQNNIEKFVMTAQVLRPSNKQAPAWFYNLFAYYVETVTNKPVELLSSVAVDDVKSHKVFDIDLFYSFYGIENFSLKSDDEKHTLWAKLYYNKEYNEKAYKYVYEIFKNSIAVLVETEHVLTNILDYYGIVYVDLNTDPVRYLDDLMFAFRSNNEAVYNRILNYKADEELFRLYANYYRTTLLQNGGYSTKDTVLFLGQTNSDRSIIDERTNEFYRVLAHKDEFEKAVSGYSKILFKPHPYASEDNELKNYILSFPNAEITTENFYKLLACRGIEKVVSISSSGCIEAQYWGKKSQVLLKDSINLQRLDEFDKDKYVSVYNDYFKLSFWSDILSPVIETKKFSDKLDLSIYKNKQRNCRGYNNGWAYEDFDQKYTIMDINRHFESKIRYTIAALDIAEF